MRQSRHLQQITQLVSSLESTLQTSLSLPYVGTAGFDTASVPRDENTLSPIPDSASQASSTDLDHPQSVSDGNSPHLPGESSTTPPTLVATNLRIDTATASFATSDHTPLFAAPAEIASSTAASSSARDIMFALTSAEGSPPFPGSPTSTDEPPVVDQVPSEHASSNHSPVSPVAALNPAGAGGLDLLGAVQAIQDLQASLAGLLTSIQAGPAPLGSPPTYVEDLPDQDLAQAGEEPEPLEANVPTSTPPDSPGPTSTTSTPVYSCASWTSSEVAEMNHQLEALAQDEEGVQDGDADDQEEEEAYVDDGRSDSPMDIVQSDEE